MIEVKNNWSPTFNSSKKLVKQAVNFTGHNYLQNANGENAKVKFFVPGSAQDSSKAVVKYAETDGQNLKGDVKTAKLNYQNGMLVAEVDLASPEQRFAYNFEVNGKTQLDLTEQRNLGGKDYALTRDPKLTAFNRPHQIYHVLPDSFNPKDQAKTLDKDGNFIWRNHFDLYGGNIDGIIEKLDYIKELGAGRIMGTPIFGADNVSCHGYWTQNPFQISNNLGNIDSFDNLNLELFKKGLGWIADGAFVNQGLMGVQFQDVLRRRANGNDESPYKNWFTLYTDPGPEMVLGVIPQDKDGKLIDEAFDFVFHNSPVNRDGSNNAQYDATKPTHIELIDPRKSKPDSGVKSSFDSVQNYKFAVNPKELKEKFDYSKCDAAGNIDKKALLNWSNFTLDSSDYDSSKQLWDGNRDVLKMNMKNPEVRNYIMKAGTFWTARVDNTLLKYTAEAINQKLAGKEANADNIHAAITALEKEGKLPAGSSEITKAELEASLDNTKIASLHYSLADAVREFPLEAIELPREVTAILSNPKFQKDLLEKVYRSSLFSGIIEGIENSDKLSEANKEKIHRPEVLRLVAQDVAKSIMTKAISGMEVLPGQKLPADWEAQLAEATMKNLPAEIFQASADVASDKLLYTINKKGLKSVDVDKIAASVNDLISNVDTTTLRASKALLNKMEAGLDWRIDAAKDVADMDGVRNGRVQSDEAFKFVKDFWKDFCNGVRNINSKAYIIGEVTDVPDQKLPDFLSSEGFSSLSNYRYMFGQPYQFVHAHPECMGWNIGPDAFFKELEQFVKAWPITAVNTAHNMADNHDKTRVLHNLLLHPGSFVYDDGPGGAMAAVVRYSLCKAFDIPQDTKPEEFAKKNATFAKLYKAVDDTAKEVGNDFGYWEIGRAITAVMKKAGVTDTKISDKMSQTLFNEVTDKYLRMLYVMVGAPGAPEIYAGTEFGMTGGESVSKNVFAQNRNPIPWIWLNGKDAKPEVQQFNSRVKAIYSLRNNKNLQVLNNGFVKDLNHKDESNGVLAFLRYNDKDQAIVIVNNGKVQADGNAKNAQQGDYRGTLPITNKTLSNYLLDVNGSGLELGTVFVNGENAKEQYIVWTDGKLRQKPANVNSAADMAKYAGTLPDGLEIKEGLILYRKNEAAQVSFTSNKKFNRIV